jgi:hypothetical protein
VAVGVTDGAGVTDVTGGGAGVVVTGAGWVVVGRGAVVVVRRVGEGADAGGMGAGVDPVAGGSAGPSVLGVGFSAGCPLMKGGLPAA